MESVKWQRGPSVCALGDVAQIHLPAGYIFTDADGARTVLQATQNPLTGKEMGLVGSTAEDWFAVFEYDDVGYVRDDEKSSLDADALLKALREGNDVGNRERRKHGWPELTILGWQEKPQYNQTTHNLEWAIRAESQGEAVVNQNTRLLGRSGVMRVTLVAAPDKLAAAAPQFDSLLKNFEFVQGHKYSEYRQGDKLAKYGLAALVVGGGTAVALKAGLFKYLWKIIVAAGVAGAALFRKLFRRKSAPTA